MSSKILFTNAKLVDESIDIMGNLLVDSQSGLIKQVFLNNETIEDISVFYPDIFEATIIDCKGHTLMPSFIDMHAHFRDPGQTQKEDLDSGLHAAVAGGYTTVVAMPNTSPVISSVAVAKFTMNRASKLGLADLYQTMSITKNFEGTDTSHLDELDSLSESEKQFLKVISEDGHDVLEPGKMLEGMQKAATKGLIVACHCEDPKLVPLAKAARDSCDYVKAEILLHTAEDTFTERNLQLAKKSNCHIHICHISTKQSIESVRCAKANGTQVTAEATPHHLGLSYEMKGVCHQLVNPPLRNEKDRLAVIEGLTDGTIDCIGTDHAPHTQQDKENGACGFTGIELSFAVCNTTLVRGGADWQPKQKNVISLSKLSKLMSANPARILGIKKGQLKVGLYADFVLVDPEKEYIVVPELFKSKGTYTPFNNRKLYGKILETWKAGVKVFSEKNA